MPRRKLGSADDPPFPSGRTGVINAEGVLMTGMTAPQRIAWFAVFVAVPILLLAPAIYNGFPLMFPDTAAYMKVAYGHFWTLDRSGFYGLFTKPIAFLLPGEAGLWVIVLIQCGIISAILISTARRVAPSASHFQILIAILAACLLTSLPWHSAQLMPDAFAGPLVLLTWVAATRDLHRPGTALLWLATGFLTLLHYTFIGIAACTAITTLALSGFLGVSFSQILKRAGAAGMMLLSAICAHVAANGLLFDRWAVAPTQSWFLFARLNEDGLITVWLDRHCGKDAPQPLCEIKGSLPKDSQALLWSNGSPLYPHIHGQIGSSEYWRWIEMLGRANYGSIADQPLRFAANAIDATARQLGAYAVLDDECPRECGSQAMMTFNPALADGIKNSRQLRDTLPKHLIRGIVGTSTTIALVLLIPFAWMARRNRDREAITLLSVVVVSLVANAAMAGALSDVHDRYQSRIIWLVPFVEILLVVRWREWVSQVGLEMGKAR